MSRNTMQPVKTLDLKDANGEILKDKHSQS